MTAPPPRKLPRTPIPLLSKLLRTQCGPTADHCWRPRKETGLVKWIFQVNPSRCETEHHRGRQCRVVLPSLIRRFPPHRARTRGTGDIRSQVEEAPHTEGLWDP